MIAEYHINKLKEVEPLMFRAGESSGIDKTFMTRTYVQGLIARMALMEGGYQTRRSDFGNDYYKNLDGNVLSFEKAGENISYSMFLLVAVQIGRSFIRLQKLILLLL